NDREVLDRRAAVEIIKHEATLRSTTLVVLGRKEIYEAFRQSGASSKNEIAQLVSEKFLEVAWKLPPKRKNWQPEHHNMAIFDAISLGLAYLANVDRGSTEIERANQEIN
ncbi:MAG TPA: hypothetical protein VFO40_10125, partial [Chthoniobacterales bacterium]|nr:hypothetical protein [Chthoniobacterales bacterium]